MNDKEIIEAIGGLSQNAHSAGSILTEVVSLLRRERPHYHWVCVYLFHDDELVLGPYVGKPTVHTRIPLHQGICGAAASTGKTLIVDNVRADPRYLACSLETRSEIVVPIIRDGIVLGEIDIDSDQPAAFTAADQELLEGLAALLAAIL